MTNYNSILKEFKESRTLFGKDVLSVTDEELDTIPNDIMKAIIKESLKDVNSINHHHDVSNNSIENLVWVNNLK